MCDCHGLQEMIWDISRLADQAMHEGLESASTLLYIFGTNDHVMGSLRHRYEVIYDWPLPTAVIPRAEATIHAEKSSPLHSCCLSVNDYQSSVLTNNNDHWWAGPAEFMTNWESSSVSALRTIVSITGYWNAYKIDIPMQLLIAMAKAIVMATAMVMMSSERKPPSMLPSQDEAHDMIWDLYRD